MAAMVMPTVLDMADMTVMVVSPEWSLRRCLAKASEIRSPVIFGPPYEIDGVWLVRIHGFVTKHSRVQPPNRHDPEHQKQLIQLHLSWAPERPANLAGFAAVAASRCVI